jgi:protein-tyrosine phosphatase
MIDLHTHILPNIDDGAGSVEEAIAMTEMLLQQGVRLAVFTPHFDPTHLALSEFVKRRKASWTLMSESKLPLLPGSETRLHDYLFHYPDLSELCIAQSNYLLLELPFEKKKERLFEAIDRLMNFYLITPVIAHIERYSMMNDKSIQKLIDMGCVIQLNTSSLMDKNLKKKAFHYLKKGFIDVIASDCHNTTTRVPNIQKGYEIIEQKYSSEYSHRLLDNSECIIRGGEIKRVTTI